MHKWIWRCGAAITLALLMNPAHVSNASETAIAGINVSLEGADDKDILSALYDFSDDDIIILQRIVEAEATGKDVESKQNIASVIINRVLHKDFPDSMHDVVFQRCGTYYQFSPVSDGRYWTVDITQDTIDAVEYVLKHGTTNDGVYFCVPKYVSKSTMRWFNSLNFLMEDKSGTYYYN